MSKQSQESSTWAKRLIKRLGKRAYRDAFVGSHVRSRIAQQIRVLREQRGWTQKDLAKKADKRQSVISRLENLDEGSMTVQTLIELANAFDCSLVVKFAEFNEFIEERNDLSIDALEVGSFDEVALLKEIDRAEFMTHELAPTVVKSVKEFRFTYQPGRISVYNDPAINARFEDLSKDIYMAVVTRPLGSHYD